MQHAKNQHIVPEFLLKNFSDDKLKIWSFDKQAINERWENIKQRSIISTPTQNYVYDRIQGDPSGSLEYYLGDIENRVSPIIENLVKQRDLTCLNNSEKEVIALFITSQLSRTIGEFGDIQYVQNQLVNFVKPNEVDTSVLNSRELWLDFIQESNELVKFILNKSWSLSISENQFYVSDNPVVKSNTKYRNEHRGNLGLNSPGIEVYLPLSSSVVLCVYCNETYSPMNNTVVKLRTENVEYLNWLQIVWADRFIYSHDSSFELIIDMIQKGQQLTR